MTASTRPTATTTGTARRHDLDWLRAVAVPAVFGFHAAHPFDQFDWHVKNDRRSLALRSRTARQYRRERWRRLAVPFLAGSALLSPVQAYVEAVHKGRWSGSPLPFYVLHQPVILVVAFVVVRWSAGIPVRLALVLAGSFAITAALCGLVGRAGVLGPLLGARPAGGGR
jgi:hypothetical protein